MDKIKKRAMCSKLLGERITLGQFLKQCFPQGLSIKDGMVIWDMLENKDLFVYGHQIAGSFRYNGAEIAMAVGKGTDYMTFYCAKVDDKKRKREFNKIIEKNGGKIKEMDLK